MVSRMAVRIGFEDETEFNPEELSTKKQEDVLEEVRKKTVYLPERRVKEFLEEGYDCVVVNTFYNDDYHLSDEEKASNNEFYKEFVKYNKMKNTYRKLDEYVIKVRELLKCLDLVAQKNGVYDPDKFKKMYLKGKINIVGLRWPRFKGKEKKDISYDYLTEFILSDRDPKEILPSYKQDYEDDELESEDLFNEGELDKILGPLTEDELRCENTFYDEDEDVDGTNAVIAMGNKEFKKTFKGFEREFDYAIKDIKRRRRSQDILSSSYIHELTYDDIDRIAEYDQTYKFKSSDDIPEFKGDASNSKDYYKYIQKLEKFDRKHTKINIGGKMKTLEEADEIQLKELLENAGWNIRNFAINKEQEEKLKKIKKLDKKKEQKLKEKLLAIKNRKKRKLNDDIDEEIRKYTKDKKKKKSKKDKKKFDYKKKRKKDINKLSKEYEDLILKVSGKENETFEDWEKSSMDFTNLSKR